MWGGDVFHHGIIKKMVVVFGAIFADTRIKRLDKDGNETALISVPLSYTPKDKMITLIQSDPELNRPYSALLPRMSFEVVDIVPDPSRKLPTLDRRVKQISDPNKLNYQWTPIPHNIIFNLYIYAKNAEDATKVLEPVLSFFRPDWTPQVELIPDMDEIRDIPFVYTGLTKEDSAYGDLKDRRILVYSLNFICKTFFYGPIFTKPIIKFTEVKVSLGMPPTANVDVYSDETITLQPGLLANGSPTTNAAASVDYHLINISDDYGFAFTDVGPQ